jgi:hypothetical protein
MSDPIQETTETNGSRRKGLEAWAASIAARQAAPATPPPPEQDDSGPAYTSPGTSQRPLKVKTVTQVQKGHQAQKNSDGVELSRNNQDVQPELTMEKARQLVKGDASKVATNPQTAPPPPTPATKTPEVKTEKAIQRAAKQEIADEAQVVTAEELQQSPTVVGTVAAKSVKSSGKTEKAEASKATEEAEEAVEEETESLIKPGNDPRASAYVRAGDFLPEGTSNPDLDDFMLAL